MIGFLNFQLEIIMWNIFLGNWWNHEFWSYLLTVMVKISQKDIGLFFSCQDQCLCLISCQSNDYFLIYYNFPRYLILRKDVFFKRHNDRRIQNDSIAILEYISVKIPKTNLFFRNLKSFLHLHNAHWRRKKCFVIHHM